MGSLSTENALADLKAEMIAKLTALIVADIEMRFFDQLQNVATYADCDNFHKIMILYKSVIKLKAFIT